MKGQGRTEEGHCGLGSQGRPLQGVAFHLKNEEEPPHEDLGESIPNRRNSKCKSLVKRMRCLLEEQRGGQGERRGVEMRLEARGLGSPGKEKDFKLKTLGSHGRDSGRAWRSWICIFKFVSDNKPWSRSDFTTYSLCDPGPSSFLN